MSGYPCSDTCKSVPDPEVSIVRRFTPAAILAIIIFCVSPVFAWGPTGHTIVTGSAIELLPPELKPFYEANSRYLIALCTLPDDWKQTHKETGNQHFIDLDMLDKPPFKGVIGEREAVEKRFGKEKLAQAGLLPWTIQERYARLVSAMKEGDMEEVVVQSAVLAHFVGDAHVPFHVTRYYDGRLPEQKGVHNRWEEILPATMLKSESIKPDQAQRIDDVLVSAFGWVVSAYGQLDSVLAAEDKARGRDPGHAYSYYKTLASESGGVLKGQLERSAEALAGVYIKAWQDAGQPELPDRTAPIYWGH